MTVTLQIYHNSEKTRLISYYYKHTRKSELCQRLTCYVGFRVELVLIMSQGTPKKDAH